MAQLEAGVKSTGAAAGFTAEQLHEQAKALQEVSTFSHVAIEEAQGILLLFQNLKGVQFTQATQAAADLATRLREDVPQAARQLGKALQDPTTGLTSLRKAGVVFTAGQAEMIKGLQESGQLAKAQALILDLLTAKLGGSAEAARNTLGGALEFLKHQWGDLFEVTQASSSGIVGAINAMGAALPAVRHLFDAFFGGIQLAALDARIAIETIADGIAKTPWGALKAAVGGATGDASLTLSGGMSMAGNQNMAELTAARDGIRAHLAAQVTGTTAATAANVLNTKSVVEMSAATRKFQAVLGERKNELDKLTALNAAYGQGAHELKLLSISYDAMIQKSQDAKEHHGAELAQLNAVTDAITKQKIAAETLVLAKSNWEAMKTSASNAANEEAKAYWADRDAINGSTKALGANVLTQRLQAAAVKEGAAEMAKTLAERFSQQSATNKQIYDAEQQYQRQMKNDWIKGIDDIVAHGLGSFQGFFDGVLRMFTKMLDTMEKNSLSSILGKKLLGVGASAISGGLLGYQIGQSAYSTSHGDVSNYTRGALGGAAAGALAGGEIAGPIGAAVGAVAGFAGGIIGVGNAAKEAAKQMAEAQKQIALSMASLRAQVSGDSVAQGIAAINADREARRKAIEDAFSGGGAGSEQVAKRNAALAEMNALEDQAIAKLKAEAVMKLAQLNEDIRVQILANNGQQAEADALAKQYEQERRFADLRKQGVDDATIAALGLSEAARDAANAAKAAATEARTQADVRLRIMAATNDPGLRAEQERLEIEALITSKASEATIALTKLAQAAEDTATASQQAAAAQQRLSEQQKASEDLNVEILRAKGQGGAADDLQFQLDQQRRLEDAQKSQSTDFVQKLLDLQQLQRDQRAAQHLIDSTTGPSGGPSAGSAQAFAAVASSFSDRTALMVVDLDRAQLSTLNKIEVNTRNDTRNGTSGGSGIVVNMHNTFSHKVEIADVQDIIGELAEEINERLGGKLTLQTRFAGSVGR